MSVPQALRVRARLQRHPALMLVMTHTLDPKDLPEQLQPLMEWISEDITAREREELAAAIYEYRDVFSSAPEDIGQTDLVTHTIDTGEHRPICLPHKRLAITKQGVGKS